MSRRHHPAAATARHPSVVAERCVPPTLAGPWNTGVAHSDQPVPGSTPGSTPGPPVPVASLPVALAVGWFVPSSVLGLSPARRDVLLTEAAECGVDHLLVGDHSAGGLDHVAESCVYAATLLAADRALPVELGLTPRPSPRSTAAMTSTITTLGQTFPDRLRLAVGVSSFGLDPIGADEALATLSRLDGIRTSVAGTSTVAPELAGRYGVGWRAGRVSATNFRRAVARAVASAAPHRRCSPGHHALDVWWDVGRASVPDDPPAARLRRESLNVVRGDSADIVRRLVPYLEAGCTTVNLVVPDGDHLRALDRLAAVKRLLVDARIRPAEVGR